MARLWRLLQQLSTKENQKVEETVSGIERIGKGNSKLLCLQETFCTTQCPVNTAQADRDTLLY